MVMVGVVMGSKSDAEAIQPALDILKEFGIEYEVNVISAHRTPEKARQYGQTARQRGLEVIIAAAVALLIYPVCWQAGQPFLSSVCRYRAVN